MKIRYTTKTLHCPHCRHTLYKDDDFSYSMIQLLWIVALPALIPYWLIKYLGLGNPDIPKIGPKLITCPNCSLPVRTNNFAVEDLKANALLTYRFKEWFTVSYILGGIFGYGIFFLFAGLSYAVCGLIALLSFLGIMAIIITYRIKLARC